MSGDSESKSADYKSVHDDLEKHHFVGNYGWDHACYHAIAERRANVDLIDFHRTRKPDRKEYFIPELKQLVEHKQTQSHW